MKQEIENLQGRIGKLMQEHLSRSDFEMVTALSPLLMRVQELHKRNSVLENDLLEVQSTLKAINGNRAAQPVAELVSRVEDLAEGRARPHRLRIKIDWKANRRDRTAEEIFEHTAAASMVTFVSRLIEEFGDDVLQKLSRLRFNRGPFLSKTPAKDFVNQAQGNLYGHKKLRGTDFFILTHSSTSQKVQDLNRVCRVLGLAPGSVTIEEVDRGDMYE
jgi:hypothetical protein